MLAQATKFLNELQQNKLDNHAAPQAGMLCWQANELALCTLLSFGLAQVAWQACMSAHEDAAGQQQPWPMRSLSQACKVYGV